MRAILNTAALAAVLALGGHAATAGAQGVNPGQPGSASGGVQAQAPGGTGTAGSPGTGTTPGMGATGANTAPGTAGSAAGGGAMGLSQDQIRGMLQSQGYSDIENLRRDGDHYTAKAERYGEDVDNLRIDARTGQVRDQARLNEDQVKRMLRDQGWSDVSDVKRDGDTITAKAKRDGRDVQLRINARSGGVTQQARGG
jgi:hypothetical protein